jgi:two-component system sensor histidine kinase BaeS
MRRRITVTIIAVVAVSLVLSGVVSLLLAAAAERRSAEADVAKQATALATDADRARVAALRNAARLLKLSDLRLVSVQGGRIVGALPAGVSATDLDPLALQGGSTVHGRHRNIVFAAAPVTTRAGSVEAFVLTRRVPRLPGGTGYFLVSAGLAIGLAGVIGDRVGRRIAEPLREAETVTARIAAGDLGARVLVEPGTDEELASLAQSINTMADGLARARGLERQFLMSVSHELRTPLTSIRGFAEAIADGVATDAARAGGVIAAESRRLERLVQDLLDLAKLDARRFSLTLASVPLGTIVLDTAEGFRPAADGYGLTLTVEADRDGPMVRADADRLAQIVANLCENALKYARTTVVVRIARDAVPAVVVEDDGPGIPATDLPLVFERLHTSSTTPGRQIGSGLGLAIVAELVGAMGGTVNAESPIGAGGGGTRMRVTLPAR